MNLLIYSTNSPFYEITGPNIGGAEVSLRTIAKEYSLLGNKVIYFTKGKKFKKIKLDNINIIVIRYFSLPIINILFNNIRNFERYIDDLLTIRYLKYIIKKENIKIIHTYASYPDTYLAILSVKNSEIPVCQRLGGLRAFDLKYYKNKNIKKKIIWSLNNVNYFLPVTKFLKNEIINKIYIKNVESRILSVIDIGQDIVINNNTIKKNNNFIFISSFKEGKLHNIILEAISILKKKNIKIYVSFIGDGPKLKESKILAGKLEINNYVKFLGKMKRNEVISKLNESYGLLHATESEGLCKSILEAMCCKVPVIASNVPAINEYVSNGFSGILVDNDPHQFSDAIEKLINDDNYAEYLSYNGYFYVKSNLNPKIQIKEYDNLFKKIYEVVPLNS